MEQIDKAGIQARLKDYIARKGGQRKAANTLQDVSPATLSQIVNGNWEKISNEMWRSVAAQTGGRQGEEWQFAYTRFGQTFRALLDDARLHANVYAIIAGAGSGKTATAREFVNSHPRAYHLQCNEYYNRKTFMQELLSAMGRDSGGMTVGEMMSDIVGTLQREACPLIILDEADKLSDQVLYFFITLYNKLEDRCGIVLCATNHLEKRILRGVRLARKGYAEIYSRIGRKFVELAAPGQADVEAVCRANGLDDEYAIMEAFNESGGDMRRVKRKVHASRI